MCDIYLYIHYPLSLTLGSLSKALFVQGCCRELTPAALPILFASSGCDVLPNV